VLACAVALACAGLLLGCSDDAPPDAAAGEATDATPRNAATGEATDATPRSVATDEATDATPRSAAPADPVPRPWVSYDELIDGLSLAEVPWTSNPTTAATADAFAARWAAGAELVEVSSVALTSETVMDAHLMLAYVYRAGDRLLVLLMGEKQVLRARVIDPAGPAARALRAIPASLRDFGVRHGGFTRYGLEGGRPVLIRIAPAWTVRDGKVRSSEVSATTPDSFEALKDQDELLAAMYGGRYPLQLRVEEGVYAPTGAKREGKLLLEMRAMINRFGQMGMTGRLPDKAVWAKQTGEAVEGRAHAWYDAGAGTARLVFFEDGERFWVRPAISPLLRAGSTEATDEPAP
jgi:hypothetical protein